MGALAVVLLAAALIVSASAIGFTIAPRWTRVWRGMLGHVEPNFSAIAPTRPADAARWRQHHLRADRDAALLRGGSL